MQTKRFPSFNLPLLAIPCLSRTYEFKQALRLGYQFNDHEKEAKYDLFYPNEPEYDDYIEVRVINDTLVYRSHDYGNQILWEAVGFANGLHPWDTIRKTLPNTAPAANRAAPAQR